MTAQSGPGDVAEKWVSAVVTTYYVIHRLVPVVAPQAELEYLDLGCHSIDSTIKAAQLSLTALATSSHNASGAAINAVTTWMAFARETRRFDVEASDEWVCVTASAHREVKERIQDLKAAMQ